MFIRSTGLSPAKPLVFNVECKIPPTSSLNRNLRDEKKPFMNVVKDLDRGARCVLRIINSLVNEGDQKAKDLSRLIGKKTQPLFKEKKFEPRVFADT